MINKNEKLMTGNYVTYHGDTDMLCKLDAQDIFNIATGYMNNEKIHSLIPLTEQWLSDFGFNEGNGYPYKFHYGYLKMRNGIFFYKYFDIEIELPFVHQLQNLYYALTGTELTLTPSKKQ